MSITLCFFVNKYIFSPVFLCNLNKIMFLIKIIKYLSKSQEIVFGEDISQIHPKEGTISL